MDIKAFIASGILEEYVLGVISNDDKVIVENIALQHIEVKNEISLIEQSLEVYANEHAINPPENLKANILNFIEEEGTSQKAPILTPNSKISDYTYWLIKIKEPKEYENMHMETIAEYESAKVVIAWIKEGETDHTHTDYSENFLIIEGSCIATINGKKSHFGPGDYASFPINQNHSYTITSTIPMKVVACLDLAA